MLARSKAGKKPAASKRSAKFSTKAWHGKAAGIVDLTVYTTTDPKEVRFWRHLDAPAYTCVIPDGLDPREAYALGVEAGIQSILSKVGAQ